MPKKQITIQRLSRREAFRLMGAAGATALVGRSLVGTPSGRKEQTLLPAS
jgi:hypothetical protein